MGACSAHGLACRVCSSLPDVFRGGVWPLPIDVEVVPRVDRRAPLCRCLRLYCASRQRLVRRRAGGGRGSRLVVFSGVRHLFLVPRVKHLANGSVVVLSPTKGIPYCLRLHTRENLKPAPPPTLSMAFRRCILFLLAPAAAAAAAAAAAGTLFNRFSACCCCCCCWHSVQSVFCGQHRRSSRGTGGVGKPAQARHWRRRQAATTRSAGRFSWRRRRS